jgi:glycosyltransferase involved in cell wall biosynthesis
MRLNILIPTTPDRDTFMVPLMKELQSQVERLKLWGQVGILINKDNFEHAIGWKRNELLKAADADYVAFVDSDDRVSTNYIGSVMEGIMKGADCCSLTGLITEDGANPLIFQHSIKYNAYKTNPEGMPVRYERYPNHLNCIKASIAKQFRFPEKNHGEDTDWATQIHQARALKTEHWIEDIIYYYDYRSKK